MDLLETTKICRAIAGMIPAQKFETETPAFWQMALADVRYEDARAAVMNLVKVSKFIGIYELTSEVDRIRSARLKAAAEIVPNVDPDNQVGYRAELRALATAAADGADLTGYAGAGVTLAGGAPRLALTAGPEVEGPIDIRAALAAGLIPKNKDRIRERERTAIEQAAFDRKRADQLAALDNYIEKTGS